MGLFNNILDRFKNAEQIFNRMDCYIEDYICEPLEKELNEKCVNTEEFYALEDFLLFRKKLPNNQWDLDVLDMICNHFEEINLENCIYEEEC